MVEVDDAYAPYLNPITAPVEGIEYACVVA
jgi:hypothetical protein